jgi:hypothetical protein
MARTTRSTNSGCRDKQLLVPQIIVVGILTRHTTSFLEDPSNRALPHCSTFDYRSLHRSSLADMPGVGRPQANTSSSEEFEAASLPVSCCANT